jgi:hypothetical protein
MHSNLPNPPHWDDDHRGPATIGALVFGVAIGVIAGLLWIASRIGGAQ